MPYLILGIIAVIILYFIIVYNGLIKAKNIVVEAWSGIDVQLKRRYDLIPNLVETVKAYASHEKGLFENIANIRSHPGFSEKLGEKNQIENQLSDSLRNIFAVVEGYPELMANQNFIELHKSLVTIEDELQMARRYYNGTVRDYNTKTQVFPNNIVALSTGFKQLDSFEVESATQRFNPEVKI